jgi:hypothetical protein
MATTIETTTSEGSCVVGMLIGGKACSLSVISSSSLETAALQNHRLRPGRSPSAVSRPPGSMRPIMLGKRFKENELALNARLNPNR